MQGRPRLSVISQAINQVVVSAWSVRDTRKFVDQVCLNLTISLLNDATNSITAISYERCYSNIAFQPRLQANDWHITQGLRKRA